VVALIEVNEQIDQEVETFEFLLKITFFLFLKVAKGETLSQKKKLLFINSVGFFFFFYNASSLSIYLLKWVMSQSLIIVSRHH